MAYVPNSGSVVAFQSDPTKLVGTVSVVGVLPTTSPAGSITSVTNPAGSITAISGAVTQLAGSILAVDATFTPPANQSVSGTVQTDVRGSVGAYIIGGSVAVSVTPPDNQSVSGAVTAPPGSIIQVAGATTTTAGSILSVAIPAGSITAVSGTVTANIGTIPGSTVAFQGTSPWVVAPNNSSMITQNVGSVIVVWQGSSVIARVTGSVATLGIAGSIASVTNPAGSITTVRINDLFQEETVGGPSIRGIALVWESNANTSVMSTVSPTNPLRILGSIMGMVQAPPGSVMNTVSPAGSITAISGTVVTPAGSITAVAGTVATTQSGTWISSVVNTVPSSVLVGASIFGQLPGGTATLGSVATLQGTNPWIVNFQNSSVLSVPVGSTITVFGQSPSIVGTYAEDSAHTTADKGLFVMGVRNDTVASFAGANGEYNPFGHDSAGRMLVKPFAPGEASQIGIASTVNWGTTNAASIRLFLAPGAGLKNYVTDFNIANTGATTTLVSIVDEDASVIGRTIAPAGGGSNHQYATPLVTQIANKAVGIIAANATSTLHITLGGFKAP